MSLLRLKSDLKSLKYGDFQTKDPLITKDINNPPSNNTLSMELTRRVDDTVRIVKLLATKPGISFVAKQAALEVVKQRMVSDGKEKILKQLAAAGLNTVKVLGSTIAQIPFNGTGTHFIRGFAGKQGYAGLSGAEYVASSFAKDLAQSGQSIQLSEANVGSKLRERQGDGVVKGFTIADDSQARSLEAFYQIESAVSKNEDLSKLTLLDGKGTTQLVDYRKLSTQGNNTYFFDYNDKRVNKETRIGIGDQGRKKSADFYKSCSDITEDVSDNVNKLNPTSLNIDGTDPEGSRDLIKFRFHIITPQGSNQVSNTNLYFRAFLDSFDDNFSSNWNAHNYIGRGENFYTYGGFDRNISLSFKIAAATRQEMFPLYRKMVMLASATAPTYGDGNFMKGTIVGLTVGDYLHRQYGVLNSVNYSWQTDYPWEIAMQNPEGGTDDDQQELPMVMNCSVQFTPIHNFVPQTGMYHYFTSNDPKNTGKQRVFEEGKMNF